MSGAPFKSLRPATAAAALLIAALLTGCYERSKAGKVVISRDGVVERTQPAPE